MKKGVIIWRRKKLKIFIILPSSKRRSIKRRTRAKSEFGKHVIVSHADENQTSKDRNNMSVSRKNLTRTVYKPKGGRSQRSEAMAVEVMVPTRTQARMNPRYNQLNRRQQNPELGFVDLAAASYECSTTGSITLIAAIAQGASVNQRIGKRAVYRSLLLRGRLTSGSTTTVADAAALVIYDKRPTGALPVITDILTSISTRAFMNDNNTGRFEVIRRIDKNLIGNSTTPSTGSESFNVDMFIPLKKRPITFEAAGTGAIGDIDMGAIYLVTVGDVATGTTAPLFTVSMRTKFSEV